MFPLHGSFAVVPASAQLLIPLVLVVLFWLVLMRPARNQQRSMQALQRELAVGDEVVLSAGIFGTIRSLDDGKVSLEVAPGTVLTVARQAVVRRAPGAEPTGPTDPAGPPVATTEPHERSADEESE
jgi:preprotein translocase subunit YajC